MPLCPENAFTIFQGLNAFNVYLVHIEIMLTTRHS